MSKKFNTLTKIIRESERTLERIKEGDNKLNMIRSQGSSLLLTLLNGEGENDDTGNRDDLLDCAQLMNCTYEEIFTMNSMYSLSQESSEIRKWLEVGDINLLRYVPDCIKEIRDSKGNLYSNKVKDLTACFAPFKFWEKPVKIEEGGKKEKGGDYTKRGETLRSDPKFTWDFMDFPENGEKIRIIKEIQRKIAEGERSISNKKKRIAEKERELVAAQNEPDEEPSFWDSFWGIASTKWTKIKNIRNDIAAINSSINKDREEIREGEKEISYQKKSMKRVTMGAYYDDMYLLQRTVEEFSKKRIRIVTGVSTSKGKWGKTNVNSSYDEIVQDVSNNKRESTQNPILPNPKSFLYSIRKNNYYSNYSCLSRDIDMLNIFFNFRRNGIKYSIKNDFFTSGFKYSYNDIKNGISVDYHDEDFTLDYAHRLSYKFPEFFYYEYNGQYMLAKNTIEFVPLKDGYYEGKFLGPVIKEEYKSRYDAANPLTKLLVYDKDDFKFTYKDHKWVLRVFTKLEDSNLSKDYWNSKFNPTDKFSDEAFNFIANKYRGNIINDLEKCKEKYLNSPEINRCEDYEPWIKYDEFINKLNNYKISSPSESYSLCNYCKNTILEWSKKRIQALINTVSDEDSMKKFFKVFYKRMRKNTGSLMLWYQSIINFDDIYIDAMLGINIIKEEIKDMMVTTGCNQYSKDLFNNIENPSFIDIQNVSYLYDGRDFRIGDYIYIIRGLQIQSNKIVGDEIINIPDPSGSEGKTIPVRRLYLSSKLLNWCKVSDPTEVIICKLL